MSAEKKRLFTVDALKGLAILVVVTYHLIAPSPFRKVLNHFVEIVLILFFITSGYFYRPGKRTLGESIATRAKATMIPFLSYSLAFWAIGTVCLLIAKTETFMEAIWCLRNFFGGCIWNRVIQGWFGWEYHKLGSNYMFLADFWFLIALLLSSILFFLIADKVLDSWKKSAVCVVLLFAASGVMKALQVDLPYNIQLIPFWSAFILLGAMAGQHKLIENPPVTGAAGWITGVVLLAGGIAVSLLKEPSTNLFRGSFGENEPVQMLLIIAETVLAVSGLTLLFRLAENAGLRMKEFAWLGVHSLIIFLGHVFVAWIISGITGFSLKYKEPVEAGVVAGSVWVCLGSLTVTVLWALLLDRIKKAREAAKEKEKEAAGQ